MVERMVQVPVSLIERAEAAKSDADAWRVVGDLLLCVPETAAALSQPTPSAEPHDVELCDCGEPAAACAAGRALPVEPPCIEDMAPTPDARLVEEMAPNTTFSARIKHESEDRWARLGGAGVYVMNARRQVRGGWLIDPSTIRDVTPPSTTPEVSA